MSYICPNCGCKEATVSKRWPEDYLCPFVVAECPECSTIEESQRDAIDFEEFEQRWRRSRRRKIRTNKKTDFYNDSLNNYIYNNEHSEYL